MKKIHYNISDFDRMFFYVWYEITNPNETKFGQRYVFAKQDPWEECINRVRESIGVRKDLFDDGTIVIPMIWDVTKLAIKYNMFDKKSKFDDFVRKQIGGKKDNSKEVHNMNFDIFIDKVNEFLRKENQNRPELTLSSAQFDDAVYLLNGIRNGKRRILAELAPRYGKTTWSSAVALESGIPLIVNCSYVLTSFTSFKNDIRKFQQFQEIEIVDSQEKEFKEKVNRFLQDGRQVMVFLSLCNGTGRGERVKFLKNLDVQKFVIVDEADYGSHQKNQFDALNSMVNDSDVLLLMSGTNSDRASSEWNIDLFLSTTYFELLVNKKNSINFVE